MLFIDLRLLVTTFFSVKRWNRKFTQLSVIIRTKVRIMISRFCFASNATLILRKLVQGGRVTCLPELRSQLLGCFLVLRKLLFVSFCVVVWVLFSVFSIFCITSLVSATPRNHQLLIHFLIKLDEPFRRETKRWLG